MSSRKGDEDKLKKEEKGEGNDDEKRMFAGTVATLYITLRMPSYTDESLPWMEKESEQYHPIPVLRMHIPLHGHTFSLVSTTTC